MTAKSILSLKCATCQRGSQIVLERLTFQLCREELLFLTGPNGVGKTSLLRMLAGFSEPSKGHLIRDLDQVVYAGHLDSVKFGLSVAENVGFWARLYKVPVDEALFARLNLGDLKDRLAGRLSAGQRRRLGLARVLLSGRDIWLLDEPTSSLDTQSCAVFDTLLQDHLQTGGSAIIATHQPIGIAGHTLDLSAFGANSHLTNNDEAFL